MIMYDDFMNYVVDLIDRISIIINNRDNLKPNELAYKISDILFEPENRIMLGVLIVMISFILYLLDVSTE